MSFQSLHTRCAECDEVMFVHTDNPDVVYCECEEFTPPRCEEKGTNEEAEQ